ncbi:MAG: GNAT family N-acetyltransferase [Dehalococcoidia bacterium]|jgi:RimJ/RimL family protein N-acetyltransferase|nr:GNAT family N-acetyltransferase [Dehalococcoidia bacterium]
MTATAPQVVVTGTLVRIREKRLEDAALDHEWRKDPELAAYDAAQPLTMSLRAYVATVADEIETPATHRRSYSIDTLDDDRHIGNLMYYGYDPGRAEAELGITIGDRGYWSRGYGSDAVKAMLCFLFDEMGMRRVYLHTLTWNDRAQQAFTRAGFLRVREVRRGGYDFVLMEVLREQFELERAGD